MDPELMSFLLAVLEAIAEPFVTGGLVLGAIFITAYLVARFDK